MAHKRWLVLLVPGVVLLGRAGQGAPPASRVDAADALSALTGGNAGSALASNLRNYLLAALPDPLYEDQRQWGKQKSLHGRTRNDGHWRKVRIDGRNLHDTLLVDIRDVQKAGPGKKTLTLYVMFDATVLLERQRWKRGVRLYSGSTRARVRLHLSLNCEVETRMEKGKGSLLPEAVFRLHVAKADFGYDNLVVEHMAGVSGEVAKVLGDAVIGGMKRWKPSLERHLIDKANAAIVKASDTKEVKIGLSSLFK